MIIFSIMVYLLIALGAAMNMYNIDTPINFGDWCLIFCIALIWPVMVGGLISNKVQQ